MIKKVIFKLSGIYRRAVGGRGQALQAFQHATGDGWKIIKIRLFEKKLGNVLLGLVAAVLRAEDILPAAPSALRSNSSSQSCSPPQSHPCVDGPLP